LYSNSPTDHHKFRHYQVYAANGLLHWLLADEDDWLRQVTYDNGE